MLTVAALQDTGRSCSATQTKKQVGVCDEPLGSIAKDRWAGLSFERGIKSTTWLADMASFSSGAIEDQQLFALGPLLKDVACRQGAAVGIASGKRISCIRTHLLLSA
jgi:hypothetical protein